MDAASALLGSGVKVGELTTDTSNDTTGVMKEVSAAELRQAMGKVAKTLARTGEPILLKLGSKPVGVLVSSSKNGSLFTKPQIAGGLSWRRSWLIA
jgi:hypothetical protein